MSHPSVHWVIDLCGEMHRKRLRKITTVKKSHWGRTQLQRGLVSALSWAGSVRAHDNRNQETVGQPPSMWRQGQLFIPEQSVSAWGRVQSVHEYFYFWKLELGSVVCQLGQIRCYPVASGPKSLCCLKTRKAHSLLLLPVLRGSVESSSPHGDWDNQANRLSHLMAAPSGTWQLHLEHGGLLSHQGSG